MTEKNCLENIYTIDHLLIDHSSIFTNEASSEPWEKFGSEFDFQDNETIDLTSPKVDEPETNQAIFHENFSNSAEDNSLQSSGSEHNFIDLENLTPVTLTLIGTMWAPSSPILDDDWLHEWEDKNLILNENYSDNSVICLE